MQAHLFGIQADSYLWYLLASQLLCVETGTAVLQLPNKLKLDENKIIDL
jgi:hypothetical protein